MAITVRLVFIFFMVLHVGDYSALGIDSERKLGRVYDDNQLSSNEEEHALDKEKVVVMKNNIPSLEFQRNGQETTITGHKFKFNVQKYTKAVTVSGILCFNLVTVFSLPKNVMLDQMKISCNYKPPEQPIGSNIRFEAIIFELFPSDVVYVVKGGDCLRRYYTVEETSNAITKVDYIMASNECDKLSGRSKEERISGHLPGEEPLWSADITLMNQQIVVLLKGNIKHFDAQKYHTTIPLRSFQVDIKEFRYNNDCVRIVTITRKDLVGIFDEVRIPCSVEKPVITNDEDILLNFGNIIYIRDFSTVVFVTKNGVCVQRNYYSQMDRIHHKIDNVLSLADCYQITRWRLNQRMSDAKLNRQPPLMSVSTPGTMWLLAMDADTRSYTNGKSAISTLGSGIVFLDLQDFYKGDEECIRVLTIKLYGAVVERLSASCGPNRRVYANTYGIHYGRAFVFKAELATNTFIGLYNVKRDGSCLKIIYNVAEGNPDKLTKTNPQTVTDMNCKDLSQGRSVTRINSSKNGQEKKGAAQGWFGGFFKKLFSSAWR